MPSTKVLELSLLGPSFRIGSDDSRWIELLEQLWEPFAGIARGPVDEIEIRGSLPHWTLHADDRMIGDFLASWKVEGTDPWMLAHTLRYALVEKARTGWVDLIDLHAAAVARDGTALLLPAANSAGKTTLALALVRSGWSYLSDDVSPLETSPVRVHPFRKPVGIRDPGLWDEYRARWIPPRWLARPRGSFLLPAGALSEAPDSSIAPGLVVFPGFDRQNAGDIQRLSAAAAAAACAQFARDLTPAGLSTLTEMFRKVPAARVTYSSSDEALSLIEGLLR